MVKISGFEKRISNDGKEFNVLLLQGGIVLETSKETGNVYATAWKSSIPATFDDATCQSLIGKQLQGQIEKVASDEYEYTLPETGETILCHHKYLYNPNPNSPSTEELVFTPDLQMQQ